LSSLDGLQNLTRIGGSLYVADNDVLADVEALGRIEEVLALQVTGNDLVTNLAGLGRLTRVTGVGDDIFEATI
jgi:hypothetical protein